MTQSPNPFDPWANGPARLRDRRICRHGRQQIACPVYSCYLEAYKLANRPYEMDHTIYARPLKLPQTRTFRANEL